MPPILARTARRLALLMALAPLTALAQQGDAPGTSPNARTGPYLGASVGAGGAQLRSIGRPESGDPEGSGRSLKLRAGWWFDRHWGIEAGAVRLGRISQRYDTGTWRADGDALMLSGLGRLPLGDDWALIGRLSVIRTRLRDDGSTGDRTGFEQLNGRGKSVVLGGLGLEYALTPQAALTLEIDGLGQAGPKAQPVYLGAGVRWAF